MTTVMDKLKNSEASVKALETKISSMLAEMEVLKTADVSNHPTVLELKAELGKKDETISTLNSVVETLTKEKNELTTKVTEFESSVQRKAVALTAAQGIPVPVEDNAEEVTWKPIRVSASQKKQPDEVRVRPFASKQ